MPDEPSDQLTAILDRMEKLEAQNRALQVQVAEQNQANAMPGHLTSGGEIAIHPGVARHVVVGTRPVLDAPNDPLWGRHNKVDPNSIVQNSHSRPMRDTG